MFGFIYRVNKHSDKNFKLAREIPWILYGFLWWMSDSSLVLELASNPSTTLFLLNVGFNSINDASSTPNMTSMDMSDMDFFGVLLRFFTIPILNRCLFLLCYFGGVSWWTRFVIPSNHPSSGLFFKQTLQDGKRLGWEGDLFWTEECWDPLTPLKFLR